MCSHGIGNILIRAVYGIIRDLESQKHLHRYLAEYDFRYSHRVALEISDSERTDLALAGIVGKRLLYRDSSLA